LLPERGMTIGLLPLGSLADLPALGFSNSKSGCSHPIRWHLSAFYHCYLLDGQTQGTALPLDLLGSHHPELFRPALGVSLLM